MLADPVKLRHGSGGWSWESEGLVIFVLRSWPERADGSGMEIDISLTPICSKCERNAVAFSDNHMPLCGRHAMIFLTAPRLIARDAKQRQLEKDDQATGSADG